MSNATTENIIPLSVPEVSGKEWEYIKACLDTGWVSSVGTYVNRFEEAIARCIGAEYAVATVNGTAALHVSLIACGVETDDEVIVPTLTFIAPVNTVRYCGAYPVFMDCEERTLCMDVQKVSNFLSNECEQKSDGYTYNKRTNRRVKAIIPVHIFGHPVEMDELVGICKEYNIDIIEDATESLGSEYKGRQTGSFGKIGCFSFNGNKIITSGGGGMVVTDQEDIAKRLRHLTTQAKSDSFEYDHDEIGFNYRLTNIQAAMGVAQMEKLDEFVDIKRQNALLYKELFSELEEVEFIWEEQWARSNFWFYTIKVPAHHKTELIQFLISKGIQVRPIWKLMHTLPMYKKFQTYNIDNAIDAFRRCVNVPCSVNLKEEDMTFVVGNINKYFRGN